LFAYRFFFAGFHLPRQGFSIGTSNLTHGRKPGKRFFQQGAICASMTKGCSEYRPAFNGNVLGDAPGRWNDQSEILSSQWKGGAGA